MPSRSEAQGALALKAELNRRRGELEERILTSVYGAGPCSSVADARWLENLRQAVSAAIDCGLAAIQRPDRRALAIPAPILAHARLAAHSGVAHGTILGSYCAANLLFADAVIDLAGEAGLGQAQLKSVFHALGRDFERLLAALSEAYVREELAPAYEELERRSRGG